MSTPTHVFRGHEKSVHCAIFLKAYGMEMLVSGDEGSILVWNTATKSPIAEFKAHEGVILNIISYKQNILSQGRDGCIKQWDLQKGFEKPVREFKSCKGSFCRMALDKEQQWLLIPDWDSKLNIWNMEKGDISFTINMASILNETDSQSKLGMLMAADFLKVKESDDPLIVMAFENGYLYVTTLEGDLLCQYQVGKETLISFAIHDNQITVGTAEKQLYVLEVIIATEEGRRMDITIESALYNDSDYDMPKKNFDDEELDELSDEKPKEKEADDDFNNNKNNNNNNEEEKVLEKIIIPYFELPHPGVSTIAWRTDGQLFATAGWDRRIRVFTAKCEPVAVFTFHEDTVLYLCWANDGRLVSAGKDQRIAIWDQYKI
eukprot:TRINITY_DN182220_c0_g2_i1.p1 TRINITY_DN182220_c0_g2~~TRINITY_DN182220_c0_g2_i1.p1  ORF type:complete len:376 (+),score=80.16 TRINITY_DN182220_c0_g2_i1:65-1192(+)